uniref:Uncharacterized protein n=1 Tax=Hyaloperonospora arabidopsidis (strain Emoy2) TaxID=559515 RepID=M4C392_HYAAE
MPRKWGGGSSWRRSTKAVKVARSSEILVEERSQAEWVFIRDNVKKNLFFRSCGYFIALAALASLKRAALAGVHTGRIGRLRSRRGHG